MAWSGGTFSRVHDWTTDAGSAINIEATRMDAEDDNFATGINNCLTKDGQNTPTADLPMGGQKHTNVADATARTNYASAADVQDQQLTYAVDTGAADAYAIAMSPAITAYAEGQRFTFRCTNTNTGASTLAVNGLAATTIRNPDSSNLAAGALESGSYYEVVYDANGSRFILLSPSSLVQEGAIGTDLQAWDANLDQLAALTPTDSNFIVGNGSAWVAESGTTAQTSLGLQALGTSDSPQFASVEVGAAADTTVSRVAAGQIAVEGDAVFSHDSGTYTSAKIIFSTAAPTTEGSNGDIYFEYTA